MKFFSKWFDKSTSRSNNFDIYLGGNRSGLNIFIFTEHVNATYFISFDIPLKKMHAEGKINLAVVSQNRVKEAGKGCWEQWWKKFQPDVVVMTRYGQEDGVKILDFFNSKSVPVIYHIDDDLLVIPESLGQEINKRQGSEVVVNTRKHLLEHCDLIYASTSYLASLMQERFPRQKVFHGIYAPYMGESIVANKSKTGHKPVFGYMGSKGHQHDLELVVPTIERLLEEREELSFEVFGTVKLPHKLKRFGSRVKSHSVQKSYVEFLSTLSGLNWSVGLSPLVDSDFNKCKAPTKFIEYTACGIPVVASNVSVYAQVIPEGGGLLVDKDWYTPILRILDDHFLREQILVKSQDYCTSLFSVSILQKQLIALFHRCQK